MRKTVTALLFLASALMAEDDNILVKITKDIPYININDSGTQIRIKRIQDTSNILTDDFALTSRPCPPHCITPIKVDGIKTIGELELINFIKDKVYTREGILVDARLKKQFILETIPGAINIPFTVAEVKSEKVKNALFNALGARVKPDGSYNFDNAKDLAVFCSGLWCEASVKFIQSLKDAGYPKDKIFWYRDGLQAWKLLGLTTVVHKAVEAK
jgi:rhodanese-related sulfurtransferase